MMKIDDDDANIEEFDAQQRACYLSACSEISKFPELGLTTSASGSPFRLLLRGIEGHRWLAIIYWPVYAIGKIKIIGAFCCDQNISGLSEFTQSLLHEITAIEIRAANSLIKEGLEEMPGRTIA